MIHIRSFTEQDQGALERVLNAVWGAGGVDGYYRFGTRADIWVAEWQGQAVGFSSMWTNRTHPDGRNFSLHVHPAYQGRGIGTALFNHLAEEGNTSLPLHTRLWETSRSATRFLTERGLQEVRRTYFPTITLTDVDLAAYSVDIRPYEVKPITAADRDRLVALCYDCYEFTHRANPVAAFDPSSWERLVYDDILPDGSLVLMQEDEIAAFSIMHPSDEEGALEWGWCGVAAGHRHREQELMLALALRQIEWARAQGVTRVTTEVDSTHRWTIQMMARLPVKPSPILLTYRAAQA